MERIKNFISPRARRKKLDLGSGDTAASGPRPRTFGVPLEQLVSRLPAGSPPGTRGQGSGPRVPFVVQRLCEYIYKHGLDNVGLFRVSGSVRVVERLRLQFEVRGDADLETENDVAATAGLLRVFLRDLPDTLVTENLTPRFFSLVQEGGLPKDAMLDELKEALDLLPEENYNVLKYITSLLVVVAENEGENKMSAYSLAILFGPNVFRYELTSGMGGLRDMDSSKEVMQLFITNYDTLFAEENEPSPSQFWSKAEKRKSSPPARPPPPKVLSLPSFKSHSLDVEGPPPTLTNSSSTSNLEYRPVPSPRKIKNVLETSRSLELEDRLTPTPLSHGTGGSIPLFSPRDEMDHSRAHSPFALESETHSIIESPMITARTIEFVDKTIVQTISEHIFGSIDFNQNSGPLSPGSPKNENGFDPIHGSLVDPPIAKPRQTLAGKLSCSSNPESTSTSQQALDFKISVPSLSENFDNVERSDILTGHKKPSGPPRRTPSRKHRHSSEINTASDPQASDDMIAVPSTSSPSSSLRRKDSKGLAKPSSKQQDELSHGSHVVNHSQNAAAGGDKENQGHDLDLNTSTTLTHHHHHHIAPSSISGSGNITAVGDVCTKDHPNFVIGSNNNGSGPETVPGSRGKVVVADGRSNEERALTPQSQSALNSRELPTPGDVVQSTQNFGGLVERSPTNGIKLFIPPLDFSTLHEQVDGNEPIPVSKGQFDSQIWIKTSQLADPGENNVALVSPRSDKLRKRNGASTNTDIPPSPPIQQDIYKKHSDDECSYRLRQLTKKIAGLKKKIKVFEEAFEQQHGYKPSQGERAAQPDIKKYMNELSKARKDLKRLKESTEKGNRSRHNSGASGSGIEPSPPNTPTVSSTLEFILRCLLDKRKEEGRPEEIMLMSREQILEEKLAVQRALLHFEGLHGRPSTREEKDLMRPLYDRYRAIKRMLAKPSSPRNSLELQTVPEDQMIEIPRFFTQRSAIRIPTALEMDREDDNNGLTLGPTPTTPTSAGGGELFGLVTQDLGLLREIEEEAARRDRKEDDDDGVDEKAGSEDGDSGRPETGEANLHEMSLVELHAEIEVSRGNKKKLRRILKEFEEEFFHSNGRKVQKEDRYPLQSEYSQYKKVKARLRLLDALVLKHHE